MRDRRKMRPPRYICTADSQSAGSRAAPRRAAPALDQLPWPTPCTPLAAVRNRGLLRLPCSSPRRQSHLPAFVSRTSRAHSRPRVSPFFLFSRALPQFALLVKPRAVHCSVHVLCEAVKTSSQCRFKNRGL